MSHEHEHIDIDVDKKPQNKFVWIVWNIMFVAFYPVLAAFSLLMMIIMFISSTLSKLIFWIANLFKKSE